MNLPAKESISVRLDRLERENAVLKGLAVLLLLGFGAVLLKYTSLVRPPKQLAAEQFAVKDKEGTRDGAKDGGGLIGQFGVGFYSAFMVADRIEVVSRRAGSAEAWAWRSEGGAGFEIAPADEAQAA